ncbi:MAG: hypothetical protein IKZ55_03670 [Bacteroidales bacterium]|nr:hypothetical protein [Bacteroidales bacterium]
MLLERMTYNLQKMSRNPKYEKWLWGMWGAGLAVGGSISMWASIFMFIALYFSLRGEWDKNINLIILIIWFVLLLLGFVVGAVLEYRLGHNKLKKGNNRLPDKTIRKLNVYFVIFPGWLLLVAIIVLGLIVIVDTVVK